MKIKISDKYNEIGKFITVEIDGAHHKSFSYGQFQQYNKFRAYRDAINYIKALKSEPFYNKTVKEYEW